MSDKGKINLPKGLDNDEVVGGFKGTKKPLTSPDANYNDAQARGAQAVNAAPARNDLMDIFESTDKPANQVDPALGDIFKKSETYHEPTAEEEAAARLAKRPPEQRFASLVEDLTRDVVSGEFDESGNPVKNTKGSLDLDAARTHLTLNFPSLKNYIDGSTVKAIKATENAIVISVLDVGQKKPRNVKLSPDGTITQ